MGEVEEKETHQDELHENPEMKRMTRLGKLWRMEFECKLSLRKFRPISHFYTGQTNIELLKF